MKKIIKIAALVCALCVFTAAFAGCGATADFSEELSLIADSVTDAVGRESGEVLIHEAVDTETDIEGIFESGYVETYVRFTKGDKLNFSLERNTVLKSGEIASKYELIKDGDAVYELFDGKGKEVEMTEFPDFFESFNINYEAKNVKKVDSEIVGNGVTLYTLTMTAGFADGFDRDVDGVKVDCTAVEYGYYIDTHDVLQKMTVKYTYKVTQEGKTQTVTKLVNSEIA